MKTKKVLSIFIAALMLLAVFTPAALAGTPDASGFLDEEELFSWTVENNVLTVSYSGEEPVPMPDFESEDYDPDQPWKDHIKTVKSIVVTGNVTAIGDYAFFNAYDCTSVSLPEGIVRIGQCAFQFNDSLKTLTLPSSLKEIDYSAFYCSGLEKIVIPEGVESIGRMAFGYCYRLSVAELPSTVVSFARNVFLLCPRLYAVINRSQDVAVFDQGEAMVLAFSKVSANEKYAKYLDYEKAVSRDGFYDGPEQDAGNAELVRRYNEYYSTQFANIEELQNSFYENLLPDAFAGDYVTLYCLTGSAQQSFCEEKGLSYVLMDSGEPYCVHEIAVGNYYPPTCTENGYRNGAACLKCEKVFEEPDVIPPAGHVPETIPGTPATCTKSGFTDGVYCSECGAEITPRETIMPLGHTDENGDGICDVCNKEIPEEEEYTLTPIERVMRFLATIIDRLLAIFRRMFGG